MQIIFYFIVLVCILSSLHFVNFYIFVRWNSQHVCSKYKAQRVILINLKLWNLFNSVPCLLY